MEVPLRVRRRIALFLVALTIGAAIYIFLKPTVRSGVPVGVTNGEYVSYASSTLGVSFSYPSTYELLEHTSFEEWATSTIVLREIVDQSGAVGENRFRMPRVIRMYISPDVRPNDVILREQLLVLPQSVYAYEGEPLGEVTVRGESAARIEHRGDMYLSGTAGHIEDVAYVVITLAGGDDRAAEREFEGILRSFNRTHVIEATP